jgi:GNAT superfamily N-acetyltransferase
VTVLVRPAREADVPEMSRVLIASITKLCIADHGGVPERIAGWTANKSHEGVARMLADADHSMFVAEHDGVVAAVGLVAGDRIGLNYVDPDHRLAGISKALLAHMEQQMREAGVTTAVLESTETALGFYRSAGWAPSGECGASGCRPMQKRL